MDDKCAWCMVEFEPKTPKKLIVVLNVDRWIHYGCAVKMKNHGK